jgi:SAM-dependent methyltransferase
VGLSHTCALCTRPNYSYGTLADNHSVVLQWEEGIYLCRRYTEPEIAALWIECVEKVSGEFRDQHIYPRLRAWEGEQMDGQVLEVGSGQGVCCQCLATERRYLGVEPSEPLHLRAVEQYQNGERSFSLGNAYSLPVSDGSCAGAFSVNVWMHLSDLGKAARELSRVLVPGAGFLVITANPGGYDEWESMHFHTKRNGEKIIGGFHLPDGIDLPEHVLFTHQLEDFRQSFLGAGLDVRDIQTFGRASDNGGADWFVAIKGLKR